MTQLWYMGFSDIISKGENFCGFLFALLDNKTLLKWVNS